MKVELVNWPTDEARRHALRAAGRPRILLVDPDACAPLTVDPIEDWIRLPVDERDLQVRMETVAQCLADEPVIDEDGLLRRGRHWVALPPIELRLVEVLLSRAGRVVSRHELLSHGWPGDQPNRNVLDVHVLRLRRRIEPLGLALRTVRKRGYVLDG